MILPQASAFDDYLQGIGKSVKTAKNYSGAVFGPISKWAVDNGLITNSIAEIDNLKSFEVLAQHIRKLDIYKERNSVGNGMYNAALNAYADYLAETKGELIEQDISEILSKPDIDETQKATLVNTRIGQGAFRTKLIRYWSGCAITRYRDTNLLVASHIKPWRASENNERLDMYNGLLLLPNLDKAFDKGFISFEADGRICVSGELEEPQVLGVRLDMRVALAAQHEGYMQYHRDKVYRH